ncbi:hypothetical protein ABDD95_04010 [Mucilaginibacter sp. PAMB04274]|uniref:hypothetical protein n=1 Tax=Mucilaginibacter sp. PAMB04274 TaxID=3138568 RepID=UPI0031F66D2D
MNQAKLKPGTCITAQPWGKLVVLILLTAFIGRVLLVSIYGYAGVKKTMAVLSATEKEQSDDENSEDGRYAGEQVKCYASLSVANFKPIFALTRIASFTRYLTSSVISIYPVVLTPPPNG